MKYDGKFNHTTGVYNTPTGRKWADPKTMNYKALEVELAANRRDLKEGWHEEARRAFINRNHDLMTEMNRRWK